MTTTTLLPLRRYSLIPEEIRLLAHRERLILIGIALVGFLLRLFFWHYTHRTWEDALISVLHSENAVQGLGLTHHHPGYPPVHGFTSPLSVLVPLLGDIFHPGWGLVLIRIVSALIVIPTVLLAAAIPLNRAFSVNIWLIYLLSAYLAFEHHQILWGMAGMETQIAVFVVFLSMYAALKLNSVALGISMALCMYARPDFVFFLLVMAVYLWIVDRKVALRSSGLAAALYTPWLIFTTVYYGSPVPNTIVAKTMGYGLWIFQVPTFSSRFWEEVWQRFFDKIYLPLGPSFAGHGTGYLKLMDEGFLSRLATLFILLGIAAMIARFHRFYILPLGFFFIYSAYYIFLVQIVFGWYLAPFSAVSVLLLVFGLSAMQKGFVLPSRYPLISRTACIAYILPLVIALPLTFRTERQINGNIENPVRKAIGRYLFIHKKPGDRIDCEPLGFIGYYSRMPVLDFPGLASPEVTEFYKKNPDKRFHDRALEAMKPEWVALRDIEYQDFMSKPYMQFLKTDYRIEKIFRADDRAATIFRVDHNIDRMFYLFHKKRQ